MPPIRLCRLSVIPRRTLIGDYLRQLRRVLRRKRFRSLRFALRRAMRFFSLLDMKKRFLRISLNTRSFCTFFRKRFNSCSPDSPDLITTDTNVLHLLSLEMCVSLPTRTAAGALCRAASRQPVERPDGKRIVYGAKPSQSPTAKQKTRHRRQRHLHCGAHQVPSNHGTRFHSRLQASEASSQGRASEYPGRAAALLLLLRPGCRHSPPNLYTDQTVSATTTGRLQSPKS